MSGLGFEQQRQRDGERTYRVSSTIFFLGSDNSTTSLSSIECTLPSHDGLASSSSPAGRFMR